jgi:hypothetical protein
MVSLIKCMDTSYDAIAALFEAMAGLGITIDSPNQTIDTPYDAIASPYEAMAGLGKTIGSFNQTIDNLPCLNCIISISNRTLTQQIYI